MKVRTDCSKTPALLRQADDHRLRNVKERGFKQTKSTLTLSRRKGWDLHLSCTLPGKMVVFLVLRFGMLIVKPRKKKCLVYARLTSWPSQLLSQITTLSLIILTKA